MLMMQFTASSRRACSLSSSTDAATAALCGMVTESPATSHRRISSSADGAAPGATSKAKDCQDAPSPSTAKAALCKTGESEWATGLPITPTMVVPGPSRRRASSMVRDSNAGSATSGKPARLAERLVCQLLRVGVREGHDAVLLHEDEVEPGPGRWVEGRVHGVL